MTIEETRAAMLAIVSKAKAENRGLTPEEETQFADLEARKAAMVKAQQIEDEQRAAAAADMRVKGENRGFSLVKAIANVVENRGHEAPEARTIEQGRASFEGTSTRAAGQIVLPSEQRAATAATAADVIEKNVAAALDPLYYADALNSLGITRMSNLRGNVAIPAYAGTSVAWAAETGAATDGTGAITAKTFSPKRLTAKVVFSKQFLLQDAAGVENVVRRDLFTAISHKVQQTVFGAAAASNSPAGIFNGITAKTAAATYADILALEKSLEDNKLMYGAKYLLSTGAKAQLRGVGVGTSTTQFGLAYADGAVLGTQAVVSGDVAAMGIALADWREFVLAQWGGLDITVDPYTLAANGQIQLVVNAFFDGGFRRDNAVSAAVLKA